MMNFYEFKESLAKTKPPAELTPALAALWWAGKDNWERAHNIVMDAAGKDSAWVHAYLHRKEGDRDNAAGWYSRAEKAFCEESLQEEWSGIVRELLAHPQ